MTNTKQLKITKLFRNGGAKLPEDCDELQEEIQELEQQLREKQDELFQLQRNSYRRKPSPRKKRTEPFVRPQKIVLTNAVDSLKSELELTGVLSGIEVQSYVLDNHCCITYLMEHESEHQVKHGLRIELQGGDITVLQIITLQQNNYQVRREAARLRAEGRGARALRDSDFLKESGANEVSKSSLPLGFNLSAVMEDYDNIMVPECLGAIRKAMVAYYDRLEQFEALKKMLNIEAQLFKMLDGSHMQITFVAKSETDEDLEPFDVVLMLDYRVYDIRPKQFSFKEIDLPEGASELLREQCAAFKRKPLHKAFKEAFIGGVGPFKLVEQVGTRPTEAPRPRNKRARPARHHYNNDDTFLPEECSEHSDEADVE